MSKENPYLRKLNAYHHDDNGDFLFDVYDVITGFNVTNPGLQHALKKILTAGQRGVEKSTCDDIREAIQSLTRALQIESTKEAFNQNKTYTAYRVKLEPEINEEAFLRP